MTVLRISRPRASFERTHPMEEATITTKAVDQVARREALGSSMTAPRRQN
jgi:hypothetical protein